MRSHRASSIIATLAILLLTALASADGPSFALRAGRVLPVADGAEWVLRNGVIIVRDGRIEAVGEDLPIPSGLRLIDLPDATVMPGLVAATSDLAGQHAGVDSVGAGFGAVDAFDRYADFRRTLESGVTSVHLSPGWHRLVSGQGAVVKLGGPAGERVLRDHADLTVNLGPGAYGPPEKIELLIPPSPDGAIKPSVPQRPASRLSQYLALKEAIEGIGDHEDDWHAASLAEAWSEGRPLRVQAQQSADITGAISFLAREDRAGYLVGGWEAPRVAAALRESGLPLVYTIPGPFQRIGGDLGNDPDRYVADITDLAKLDGIELALSVAPGQSVADLRLAAATAQRAGLDEQRIVRAITTVPAKILGVDDRVGSIAPGRDADLLVLTDHPLATHTGVRRVYVGGHLVYDTPGSNALVVRAGTIWLGPGEWLEDGSVLVEDGRIVAVGKHVPRPRLAQVIDAGPDAFVAPGFIDAHGHLGLDGDRASLAPALTAANLVGAPGPAEGRVARAGVTTVMAAPYSLGTTGVQIAAIKTSGEGRHDRVVRSTAAVAFDLRTREPSAIETTLKPRIDAGKKYLEKWEKYRTELAEWEKQRAEGKEVEKPAKSEEEVTEEMAVDPLSGTWDITLTGEVIPEPVSGRIGLKLDGTSFEGRVLDPPPPVDHRIVGTLDGSAIKGEIEIDTGGMGFPQFEGEIDREDHAKGKLTLGGMLNVDFEMTRIDKSAVEFKLVTKRRRTRGKDGQPLPPKIDESLEPMRAWLEKRIPAVVAVSTPQQIDAVLAYLVDGQELPIVLLNAEGAHRHAERLREKEVGVVLPRDLVRREDDETYHQGDDLARSGVSIAFQSDAGDGARTLPLFGLWAVERGLSAESALAAMTVEAAKMYGIDDRVGSIAPGRDGDLLIYSGHPFDAGSTLERVIINGEEVQP